MVHLKRQASDLLQAQLESVAKAIAELQLTVDMIIASGHTFDDLAFYGARVWMPTVDDTGRREANEVLQLDLRRRQLFAEQKDETAKALNKG